MMKYFIYAIAVIHLGCSTSLGEETGFDRQLPAPDSIHIRKACENPIFFSGKNHSYKIEPERD